MAQLETTESVIAALGGVHAVAELAHAKITTVHNWRTRGRFPPRTYFLISKALEPIRAPKRLWGMADAPAPQAAESAE